MITKTTNLDSKYFDMFKEIEEKSEGKIKVDNLEQFFGCLQEIVALPGGEKYLRLPLDEPMFEIDANTRKINVDATPFKANGLAVQGDHLAETVFFKIDRYFDTMDLDNTIIYVNWKMGAESGRDLCAIRSTSIVPGCIVFGWPIRDKITAKSGSLQFAIQFMVEQEEKVGYALNTLVANLNVKDGLILNNPEVVDMMSNVKAILFNSQFGEGDAAVEDIVWATGDGNGLVRTLDGAFESEINLDSVASSLTSLPVTLMAVAAAGRDAKIMYSDANKVPMDGKYVEIAADSTLNDKVLYFTQIDSTTYKIATPEEIAAFGTIDAVPLFVLTGEVVLNKVGTYYINAQGVKFDEAGTKIGASAVSASAVVTVPEAETPTGVTVTAPAQDYNPEYEIIPGTETIFLEEGTPIELTASADLKDNADFGLLDFVWTKDADVAPIQDEGYAKTNLSTLIVAEQGEYKVEAKHYRNADVIKTATSKPCTVSYYASKLTATLEPIGNNNIITLDKATRGGYAKGAQANVIIDYVFATETPYTKELKFEMIQVDTGDVITATFTKLEEGKQSCLINSANIPGDGAYMFKVTNIYNGSMFSAYTGEFFIDIKD